MSVKIDSTRRETRARWLMTSLIWIPAGFVFPFLTPATVLLSPGLQRLLSSAAGMSEEMAYYVAFTCVRIPLTMVLGILVAALQCAVLRSLRPLARRWVIAAAAGACISTLIFLPSSLVASRIAGNTTDQRVQLFLLVVPGVGLLGALVSFLQGRAVGRKVSVPRWFLAASALAAILGLLGSGSL